MAWMRVIPVSDATGMTAGLSERRPDVHLHEPVCDLASSHERRIVAGEQQSHTSLEEPRAMGDPDDMRVQSEGEDLWICGEHRLG